MGTTKLHNNSKPLTYAIDKEGRLVNVDDVPTGVYCNCICPACKEPLVAKNNGTKKMHHFTHLTGSECDYAYESMLHLIAKEKIREAFLSQAEFSIEFMYKSYCKKSKQCKYIVYDKCYTTEMRKYNLKDYYDSCEQEIQYDNINRRSDLKFFSSTIPERPSIYLEFFVTHAIDESKLHSGNKIIEIKIEDVNDITEIVQKGIIENKDRYPLVEFYGFIKDDYNNQSIVRDINFLRYSLYKSGKSQCYQDQCKCNDLKKQHNYSLYEICIHTDISFKVYDKLKYIGYQKFKINNCILCTNYVDAYDGSGKICRLYKRFKMNYYDPLDTGRATQCECFKINKVEMEEILKTGIGVDFDEFV